MSGVGNNLQVPTFIKASSPQGLFRLMLLNNIRSGNKYHYQDIQFVKDAWYAWFYKSVSFGELNTELMPVVTQST
jgi:hypothetical protein